MKYLFWLLLFSTISYAQDGFVFEPFEKVVTDEEVVEKMARIKSTGASHVSFVVFICQKGVKSVQPGECNDFNAELERKLKWASIARSYGLTFDIAPFPYSLKNDGSWTWRGKFKPHDVSLWFENYGELIRTITRRSYEAGASYQIVGNEMFRLHIFSRKWMRLADELRLLTDKPLVMNVSWFEIPHGFWSAFDIIGISAYFPLALRKDAPVKAMVRSWKIARAAVVLFSKLYRKPFQFTEVGYPSANGAALLPSNYNYNGRSVDLEEQRRTFEAFRRVWQNDKRLLRALVWATDVPDELEDRSRDLTYDPFNKPAINEVKEFFRQRKQ